MVFFRRKKEIASSMLVDVEEVYVAKTTITSSYIDDSWPSPRCITWYFLVQIENCEYHELFAGKKMELEIETHKDDAIIASLDTPYIERLEPLRKYMRNKSKKKLNNQLLFDFITNMNVLNSLGALKDD